MLNQQMLSEVAAGCALTVQILTTSVLAAVLPPDRIEVLLWTMLPLSGATLAAVGAFCFNTQMEVRKIVVGRCLVALVVGVIATRLVSMVHPWISDMLVDPLLLIGAGFVHGFVGYLMSWPVVKGAYERAPAVANKQLDSIEAKLDERMGGPQVSVTVQQNQPGPVAVDPPSIITP